MAHLICDVRVCPLRATKPAMGNASSAVSPATLPATPPATLPDTSCCYKKPTKNTDGAVVCLTQKGDAIRHEKGMCGCSNRYETERNKNELYLTKWHKPKCNALIVGANFHYPTCPRAVSQILWGAITLERQEREDLEKRCKALKDTVMKDLAERLARQPIIGSA